MRPQHHSALNDAENFFSEVENSFHSLTPLSLRKKMKLFSLIEMQSTSEKQLYSLHNPRTVSRYVTVFIIQISSICMLCFFYDFGGKINGQAKQTGPEARRRRRRGAGKELNCMKRK